MENLIEKLNLLWASKILNYDYDMLLNNILYGENIFNIITNNVISATFFSFFISSSPSLHFFIFLLYFLLLFLCNWGY